MTRHSLTERTFAMSDKVWNRHANPWSGWSRLAIPPLFALAVWSRVWIGWWCLLPVVLVCLWAWWNPRAFRKPDHVEAWMSKAVLGERIWLKRHRTPVPDPHKRMPVLLAGISGLGLLPLGWGLAQLDIWPVLTGLIVILGGKLWFLDRMVWLLSDRAFEQDETP